MGLFDDLPAVFVETFGRQITLTPEAGSPVAVSGIFRSEDVEVLEGGVFQGVVTGVPTLRLRTADAAGIGEGATATVDGTVYVVRGEPKDDGRGMTALTLERQ